MHLDLPDKVPAIPGDRDQLMQAMVNLISNAVKFCDPKTGRIAISLRHQDNHLKVYVEDNGIGIRKEDQEVIFEQFRQIAQSGRGRPSGSGLGLAITRRIINHHHGRIFVVSEPGKGSKFSFILPLEYRSAY